MNALLAICFLSVLAVASSYDTSGCEKFVMNLISSGCEHCKEKDSCKKCISDGLVNGNDIGHCKSKIPDKFHKCFELHPLMKKVKVPQLGEEVHRCMEVDLCTKAGEYADKIEEYVKEAAKEAEANSDKVPTVAEECKKQASDKGEELQKVTAAIKKMGESIQKRHGKDATINLCEGMKVMFGLVDDEIKKMTTCSTSLTKCD